MVMLTTAQEQRIAQFVRDYLFKTARQLSQSTADYRAGNRWMHTLNVQKNIRLLAEGEGAPPDVRIVCDVAALFHDIDHYTVDLQYHGVRGAETAAKFLRKEGYPADFIARIADAVRNHHHDLDDDHPIEAQMREIAATLSLEARLLTDSETLDKIGASNILQSILTMGRISHLQVNDAARELTSGWPLERARLWFATLITPTGRHIGAQRLRFYEEMLKQLGDEVVILDPYPQPSLRTQEMLKID